MEASTYSSFQIRLPHFCIDCGVWRDGNTFEHTEANELENRCR